MTDDILLTIGEDGKASLYDDTYDITIHCESQEEQDEVKRILENVPHWIPVTEICECDLRDNDEVLVLQKDGTINGQIRHATFYDYNGKQKFVTWEEGITIYNVVAYMPLSEFYKGVTE